MSSAYIPAAPTEFTPHPEGEQIPAIITLYKGAKNGHMLVFRTSYGYAAKMYSGQHAASYKRQTCDTFGVDSLSELIGTRAFVFFDGNPCFAHDITPAVAIELDDTSQRFLETGEVE